MLLLRVFEKKKGFVIRLKIGNYLKTVSVIHHVFIRSILNRILQINLIYKRQFPVHFNTQRTLVQQLLIGVFKLNFLRVKLPCYERIFPMLCNSQALISFLTDHVCNSIEFLLELQWLLHFTHKVSITVMKIKHFFIFK